MAAMKYSAGLMSQSFWFIEFKKIVKHINDGKSIDEIRALCLEDNLLGISKAYRAKRIYGYIINRVRTLDSTSIKLFCDSDLSTQKLINLITILRTDRLFFEFVYEVYREKLIIGANELSDSDFRIFFKDKQIQSEKVAKWQDYTLKRLGNCYKTMLMEAGLIDRTTGTRKVLKPIIDRSLEECLKTNGMEITLHALIGVR